MSCAEAYCNCQTNRVYRNYEFGHGKLVPVPVDENDMCALCGHYPVWISKHKRYLRWSKLTYSGYRPLVLHGTNYLSEWERAGLDRDVARNLKEDNGFEGHTDISSRMENKYGRSK